eukprot:m.22006 g.22006  ORF g.22006 m.22006 type:complete len:147 (+) comp8345_c0_seq1:391-831(+)
MASSRPPSHAPSHDGGRRPRDMRAAIQRHDLSPSPSVKQQPEGYRAPSYLPPPYCPIRSDIYEKLSSPVGKGQFGAVWKCVNRRTRETCALKKVLMKNETEGVSIVPMVSFCKRALFSLPLIHETMRVLCNDCVATCLGGWSIGKS